MGTRKEAIEKAKVTLKITKKKKSVPEKKSKRKSMPTPSAIYKELMSDANREAVPMHKSSKPIQSGSSSCDDKKREEKINPESCGRSSLMIPSSSGKVKTSRSVSRLKDSLSSGSSDPAPSTVGTDKVLSPPRKRPQRTSAKTSPYFSKKTSGRNKQSRQSTSSPKIFYRRFRRI